MDTVQLQTTSARWTTLTADDGQAILPAQVSVAVTRDGAQPAPGAWAAPAATEPSPGGIRASVLLVATAVGLWSVWARVEDNPSTVILRVEDVQVVDGAASLAEESDLTPLLGPYGVRLPSWVDPPAHLRAAHSRARALLAGTYGSPLGAMSGEGTELVRAAEAGLAAASILRSLATQQQGATAVLELAALLTRDALQVLSGRVPGLVVAGGGDDDEDGTGSGQDGEVGWTPGGSLLRDPYSRAVVPQGARWSSGDVESVWFPTPEVIRGI